MITNTGKNILAKYLIGQTSSYASHIAVGCGRKPLAALSLPVTNKSLTNDVATLTTSTPHGLLPGDGIIINGVDATFNGSYTIISTPTSTTFTYSKDASNVSSTAVSPAGSATVDFSKTTSLNFEMFRAPITSRGYVNENGTSKIVFTAELPTEDRYEITEVGVYSAGSNQLAGTKDSRILYSFTQNENWEHHTATAATSIPVQYSPLDVNSDNIISVVDNDNQELTAFQTNSDNRIFTYEDRESRYERCRFSNNTIAVRGDDSDIIETAGVLSVDSGNHLHLTNVSLDLDQNAPTDLMKVAFSVINRVGYDINENNIIEQPDVVRLLIQFKSTESNTATSAVEYANFEIDLVNGEDGVDFENNRYFVISKRLEELRKSPSFTWRAVDVVTISASAMVGDSLGGLVPSQEFYVLFDAIRLDNVTTVNPLYGLTGYSVIVKPDEKTVLKAANTSNLLEFRFGFDLDSFGGA